MIAVQTTPSSAELHERTLVPAADARIAVASSV
jgi:hypothetical protein